MESRFEAVRGVSLTRIIGRDAELQLLLDRWEMAEGGEGQVVLISGEAGMGKSRLLQGLSDQMAAKDHIRMRYQCSPYHGNSPLYPTAQQLGRSAGIVAADTDDAKLDKLEALLRAVGGSGEVQVRLFANLLSLPGYSIPAWHDWLRS